MADGLDAMSIGIQDERAVIVRVIVRPQPRPAIVAPARGKRRCVKRVNGRLIGGTDAEMGTGNRRPQLRLRA
jgi:hypothetical protein